MYTNTQLTEGLMERMNPGIIKDGRSRMDVVEVSRMKITDIAANLIQRTGIKTDLMNKDEIIKRALSTTDLPAVLNDSITKTLRQFYANVPQTDWNKLARRESVRDFRTKTGVKVDGSTTFAEIPELGEYQSSKLLTEEKAQIKVKKYGRKFVISYESMINDDLSVFNKIPDVIHMGGEEFKNDMIFDLLTDNAKTPDGKALFSADHANITTPGTALNLDSLDAARVAMRRKTSPNGVALGIVPKYLIVPSELETTAQKMIAEIQPTRTQDVNVFSGQLEIITVNSFADPKAWYLAADPNQTTADGLIYAQLEDDGLPVISTYQDFNTDATIIKAGMTFGAAAWGFQGWYKNDGE